MKFIGLEYLKCNDEKQAIPNSLSELPESMKLFLQFFKQGEEREIYQFTSYRLDSGNIEKIRWQSTDKTKPWIIEGDRMLNLLTLNELELEYSSYKAKEEMWHLDDFIRIGNTHSELILLKLHSENSGSIYLYGDGTSSMNIDYHLAAENIFDLLHQIELSTDDENLKMKGANIETLNRNINQNYWKN